jgi:hypothetical protein
LEVEKGYNNAEKERNEKEEVVHYKQVREKSMLRWASLYQPRIYARG